MLEVPHLTPSSMDLAHIVGDYQTTSLTHFDGNVRTVYYTEKESFFDEGEKITSCTDPEGYITIANSAFYHMSGYSKKELIGMPHYIIHHPDIPKIVFKEMWASLKAQGKWTGYVKNLRKDGGFYWVYASIFSNFRNGRLVGYTSARSAAPRDKVELCSKKYAEWLLKEKEKEKEM